MIMNIDFSRLQVWNGISHKSCSVVDVREAFADVIYNTGNGIAAHTLALKIYNSKGAEEYSDAEAALIREYSEKCTPQFIDSIGELFNKDGKEEAE